MIITPAQPTIFFGAWDLTDWQRSTNYLPAINANDVLFGKKQSASHAQLSWAWGYNSDGSPKYQRFYAPRLDADRKDGRVSVMTWMQMNGGARTDPAQMLLFNNEATVAGKHDAYIDQFARDVAAWGKRLIVRLNPEMNGWWEGPFSEYDSAGKLTNGNTAGSFVRAWRYVVDRVRPIAPNIEWYWCCNPVDRAGSAAPTASDKLKLFWPGDDYVDWSGLDLYNKGTTSSSWRSFQQCVEGDPFTGWPFNTMEAVLRLSAGKPWIIGEWGCSNIGGDKSAWIKEMLRIIPIRYPFIRGILSYNVLDTPDWRISADPAVAAAFAAGVASPSYMTAGTFPLDVPTWRSYSLADTAPLDAQIATLQTSLNNTSIQVTDLSTQLSQANSQLTAKTAELGTAVAERDVAHDEAAAAHEQAAKLANELADAHETARRVVRLAGLSV